MKRRTFLWATLGMSSSAFLTCYLMGDLGNITLMNAKAATMPMSILKLAAFKISSSLSLSLDVSNVGVIPGIDLLHLFEEADHSQHFAWFPSSVTFFPPGESGIYWIEIFLGDSYEVDPNADFAVLLPFIVTADDAIQVGGSDDRDETQIIRGISKGYYKLLYQDRYLTQFEIDEILVDFPNSLPKAQPEEEPWLSLGPKICRIMLVPTSTKIGPELLKAPKGTTIKLPLNLHH